MPIVCLAQTRSSDSVRVSNQYLYIGGRVSVSNEDGGALAVTVLNPSGGGGGTASVVTVDGGSDRVV